MKIRWQMLCYGLSTWPVFMVIFGMMLVLQSWLEPIVPFNYHVWMCLMGITFAVLALADMTSMKIMSYPDGRVKEEYMKK